MCTRRGAPLVPAPVAITWSATPSVRVLGEAPAFEAECGGGMTNGALPPLFCTAASCRLPVLRPAGKMLSHVLGRPG